MPNELVAISPEGVEVANAYITMGNIKGVADLLSISEEKITHVLATREVKKYIDTIYLDTGYRNRNNIASLLDTMIQSKVDEAAESEVYSSKDLADLLAFAHKIRMDEIKMERDNPSIKNQTNVMINEGGTFGQGNYGKLMEELFKNA
ncbi:MAG TPA: hypothetical protein VMV86_07150 [Methanosarcinales archaeon]|nr:hypothetical protein [Methanosarcinales archaeon]